MGGWPPLISPKTPSLKVQSTAPAPRSQWATGRAITSPSDVLNVAALVNGLHSVVAGVGQIAGPVVRTGGGGKNRQKWFQWN